MADYDNFKKENINSIYIKKEALSKNIKVTDLNTIKSAYEKIIENAPIFLDKNILRSYNINDYLKDNLTFNKSISDKMMEELLKSISLTKGRVQSGEKIIDHGDIVSEKTYGILNSLKQRALENSKNSNYKSILSGQIILIISILA